MKTFDKLFVIVYKQDNTNLYSGGTTYDSI